MLRNVEQEFMQRFEAMGCQVHFSSYAAILMIGFTSFSWPIKKIVKLTMLGDAYHITRPHNNGRGAILAMRRAIEQAWYFLLLLQVALTIWCIKKVLGYVHAVHLWFHG